MNFTHKQFSLFIHILVAFVFLVGTFRPYLPVDIYNFVEKHRNTIFGCYYVYLSYEIYLSINIEAPSPVNSAFASPVTGTFE
jgi:hypothetical protein